jgi:hypothetical protein
LRSAGRSASAQYRLALGVARRRRLLSGFFVVVALALLGAAGLGVVPSLLVVFAVAAGVAAWVCRAQPDPERWLRGAAGEEATAALLERLTVRRWVVRHDLSLPGSRANVDHLVIGPTGVWAVDSKAYRAPLRIRRGRVWAGRYAIDTGPAVYEASRVAGLLGTDVTPIIAVHGTGLRRRGKRCSGVRIVSAARLVRRVRRGRRVLAAADVAALSARADGSWPA